MAEATKSTAKAETQKPSLGRVVLVPERPDHNNSSNVASAVITGVHSDDVINVRVFADNSDTPEWRTSLNRVESTEEFETEGKDPKLNAWCWPPRV